MRKMPKSLRAFNVYIPLSGDRFKLIDTVYYNATDNITTEEVKQSLVNHDGYDPRIVVGEEK